MTNMSEKLYLKIKSIMDTWHEDNIYAISFFVYPNDEYEYNGFSNVSSFAVSYNTEDDCKGAGQYDEERWNYAFWRQDETTVIDPDESNELTDLLFDWYKENGILNIGEEDEDCYDENYNYIGKGPVGHYELLELVSKAAKRLQQEGFIENKFGKKIPIIIHGLEYAWYDIEATQNANINGEADTFLKAMQKLGMI
ncbi:MAG: hypothetical protein J1F23_08620 [Oscillospiraceae bacterium]|nr:hypothetical protein [Oscillospiraceae bacterium]